MNDTAPRAQTGATTARHYALTIVLLAMLLGPGPAGAQQPGAAAVVGVTLPGSAEPVHGRARFIGAALATLIKANAQLSTLQKQASAETGDVKTKLELDNATFKEDITAAEDRVADLKKAEVGRWTLLRHDVQTAMARVHADMRRPAREPVAAAPIP
jgi:hypothetical protein